MKIIVPLTIALSLTLSASNGLTQTAKKKRPKPTAEKVAQPNDNITKEVDSLFEPSSETSQTPTPSSETLAEPAPLQPTATTPTDAPAPAAPPVTPPPAEPTPAPSPSRSKISDPHYFGFHAAIGFPHPLSGGLNYVHSSQIFSVELNTGSYKMEISDVEAKLANTELGLRWHPFMGSFYLGSYFGTRALTIEKSERISGQKVDAKVEVTSSYTAPHFGWMWGMSDGGFFSSMELGVLSPSGVKTKFSSNADTAAQATQEYQDLDEDVRDQGKKLGKTSLPMWTVLKIGWLF